MYSSLVFVNGFLVFILFVYPHIALAGNNTITDEVFFDVKVEKSGKNKENWKGRFVVGVFGDTLPITSFNFISLAKGYVHGGEKWSYKDCIIHRIVPDFLIQTGDVLWKDGRGGRSIYAPYFIDENYLHSHRAAGYVAMANTGIDTNNSQFYITLSKCRWLDRKNVVFGKVIKGMDVIERLSEIETNENGYPRATVYIAKSGVLPTDPYDLTEEDLDKSTDIRPVPSSTGDFVEL